MQRDRTWYWTLGLWVGLAALVVGGLTGCTHTISNEGGYTFTFGTSLSVMRTAKSTGGEATKTTETLVVDKALMDWIIDNEQSPDVPADFVEPVVE